MAEGMGAKAMPENEKEPKKLYSAELGEDGHYADLDLARYVDQQLEESSNAAMKIHNLKCDACREKADVIGNKIWENVKKQFPGFEHKSY